MKNNKNIIIIALLVVIVAMAVAYSTFATQLTLDGNAEIVGEWDVKIVSVEAQEFSEGGKAGTPTNTNTSVTFKAELNEPGDYVTYLVTIENAGTIDAKLQSATFEADDENGSPAINYTTTQPETSLKAGQQTTFTVTVKYDENTKEVPEIRTKTIKGTIDYVQE